MPSVTRRERLQLSIGRTLLLPASQTWVHPSLQQPFPQLVAGRSAVDTKSGAKTAQITPSIPPA
jgi:hypothetical protein